MIHKIYSEKETREFAKSVARLITDLNPKKAVLISLKGDLGAGKTVFSKGFLSFFGVKRVLSPTFVLMKRYNIKSKKFDSVYHFDCYRLHSPNELEILRIKEILGNPRNVVLMEWPEKAGKYGKGIKILINHGKSENERIIKTDLVI